MSIKKNSSWKDFISQEKMNAAGIVVCFNDKDEVLILRRSSIDKRAGQWTIPGGHIDDTDASIEEGALRELKEETNLSCHISNLKYLGEPKPEKYYFLAINWHGQINVSIPNPESGEIEHDDYKWAAIDDIKQIANSEIPIYLLNKALEMLKNEQNSQ